MSEDARLQQSLVEPECLHATEKKPDLCGIESLHERSTGLSQSKMRFPFVILALSH